jgi:hypothetical protein
LNHSQYFVLRTRDYDPSSYVVLCVKYPLSQHLAGSEDGFKPCRIQIGKFGALRVGIKFANVEEKSGQYLLRFSAAY